jgi:pyocin large subunit-like protein
MKEGEMMINETEITNLMIDTKRKMWWFKRKKQFWWKRGTSRRW